MSASFARFGMNLSASVAAWPHPTKGGSVRVLAKVAAAMLAALVLAQYLAGCIFLLSFHEDPRAASPLTIARYVYYYGDHASVRSRAQWCTGTSLALVAGVGLAAFWPRRRSLHGDARFARRREVTAAGLLGDEGIILGRMGRRCVM